MAIAEPAIGRSGSPLATYFAATRPAFLLVTLGACAIGLAAASRSRPLDLVLALVTCVFAMAAHAGANVLNDYYDSRSGNDACNTGRLYPFTGGSRFIQNGVLTERATLAFGVALFAATVAAGLWLMAVVGRGLFAFGAVGLLVGWAYSGPPMRLNSRGIGEVCIWLAWALVAAGAHYVQSGSASGAPWIAAGGYALLVTNVLLINEFPDARADEAVGKRHAVVRLGPECGAVAYAAVVVAANAWIAVAVTQGLLPPAALAALLAAPLSALATASLWKHRREIANLRPAIVFTIAAALTHASVLSLALALA